MAQFGSMMSRHRRGTLPEQQPKRASGWEGEGFPSPDSKGPGYGLSLPDHEKQYPGIPPEKLGLPPKE
jgi:hypothetical protein